MKFFDENYSQEIPARIKCLRKKYNLKQSDLGNAGQVSQVESGKRPITSTMLVYLILKPLRAIRISFLES